MGVDGASGYSGWSGQAFSIGYSGDSGWSGWSGQSATTAVPMMEPDFTGYSLIVINTIGSGFSTGGFPAISLGPDAAFLNRRLTYNNGIFNWKLIEGFSGEPRLFWTPDGTTWWTLDILGFGFGELAAWSGDTDYLGGYEIYIGQDSQITQFYRYFADTLDDLAVSFGTYWNRYQGVLRILKLGVPFWSGWVNDPSGPQSTTPQNWTEFSTDTFPYDMGGWWDWSYNTGSWSAFSCRRVRGTTELSWRERPVISPRGMYVGFPQFDYWTFQAPILISGASGWIFTTDANSGASGLNRTYCSAGVDITKTIAVESFLVWSGY